MMRTSGVFVKGDTFQLYNLYSTLTIQESELCRMPNQSTSSMLASSWS